jgi:prepilin-type N-terminal cleavage/methylation domain-containing protein
MSLRNLKLSNNKGDTIIEVMVVLAILGLAIGISYATANNSLMDVHQADEHATATELAQSQIEELRTLLAPGLATNIFVPGPYCLVPSGSSYVISPTPPVVWPGGTYPNGCQFGTYPTYTISVEDTTSANPSVSPDFLIVIKWPDIRGQGTDTVTLNYQVNQSS